MNEMSALPAWDLRDLYQGVDDPAIDADFGWCEAEADRLRADLNGRIADAAGDALAEGIARYEALQDRFGRLMAFSFLNYCTDMQDGARVRFFQATQEKVNRITAKLLFFSIEINHLEEDDLQARMAASPALAHYGPWLRDLRTMRKHVLSDELERLFHEKSITAYSAWTRLFDQTMAGLVFTVGGKEMPSQDAINLLSNRDRKVRQEAAAEISRVLGDNVRLFALITNTLIRDKQTEDEWRGIAQPEYGRHMMNQVEPEVVDALRDAVFDSFPRLSHRYYALKAKWLGLEKLEHHDRNAPLPDNDDAQIPWNEAVETVLHAYDRFSGGLADVARSFFDKPWIDAAPKAGKSPGAFAHPVVPSAHPYLLMNYQGKVRDVMTLAHELGHGCHQVLAAKQGPLMCDTPLTLAETASVFGEMLTFQSMLAGAETPERRRLMLASKVEDMINTVVRQTAFYEFERRLHHKRREGELAPEEIGGIWLDVQRESLGPVFDLGDDYGVYWAYIPHFVHTPFYVYAYAFGDCLVNALYQTYQAEPEGFQEKYLEMLSAGGTLRHRDLLQPFGLDASDPQFWQRGLTLIEGFIDELEAMQGPVPAT
ncbi:MAG: oligoendopeptidase F [Rhizobiales bacterium NRL2]|jgi:oligoendopeptidase F|nr:MAG: oligoendopeptidase F [Rhizobiales bacterium NRL2]